MCIQERPWTCRDHVFHPAIYLQVTLMYFNSSCLPKGKLHALNTSSYLALFHVHNALPLLPSSAGTMHLHVILCHVMLYQTTLTTLILDTCSLSYSPESTALSYLYIPSDLQPSLMPGQTPVQWPLWACSITVQGSPFSHTCLYKLPLSHSRDSFLILCQTPEV